MEYVHLKDQRGSGTEPVNVLSRYKYQDGLAYYESTRDTASHFFIDYLPKGTYVFEYSTRVQLRGQYQTGIAEIQCMYAPEFNSHSESLHVEGEVTPDMRKLRLGDLTELARRTAHDGCPSRQEREG